MSRRIDIELTSSREDGSWTWRAAGAREPKGTLEGAILPGDAAVGQVLRAEVEGFLDGISVVSVTPPRAPRSEPQRIELKSSAGADQPLVTSTLAPKRSGERGRRNDRGRDRDREGGPGRRDRRDGRDRQEARHDRPSRPAPPPVEEKPKPKRLRPGRTHRNALLEAVPAEQRPIAEQMLAGGIPAVRQAIDKQNEELKAEGKPEFKPDALLKVAEDLRPRVQTAVWRDRAEAAVASVDDLDLRDLRSVVNAAGDAGRDEEARALAAQLREALAERVETEHNAWLAELAETVTAGRVVRALRLSSRPPKAGAPIPGDVAIQLAEATAASLTDETGPDRWATVLDALAYSPVRRRVVPQSLPTKLTPDLRATIARLASRLPEIAHIFDIEPDPAAERAARDQARRRPGRKGDRKPDDRSDKARSKPGKRRGEKGDKPEAKVDGKAKSDAKAKETEAKGKDTGAKSDATGKGDVTTDRPAAEVDAPDVQVTDVEAPSVEAPEAEADTATSDTPAGATAAEEPTPVSDAPESASADEATASVPEAEAEPEATPSPVEAPADAAATEQQPAAEAEAEPEVTEAQQPADEPATDAEAPAQGDVRADS